MPRLHETSEPCEPSRGSLELSAWLAGSSLSAALLVATDNPWFLTGAVVLACCGYGRCWRPPR